MLPLRPVLFVLLLLPGLAVAGPKDDKREQVRTLCQRGREAVARIVGRDTAEMDEPAVARATIESAAENLSDGVIAPAFWFLLLGLPGLLV